jgi:hypothetical protein
MQSNAALQFLPTVRDDKKIEISLEDGNAVIKLSTFTEGLGWSCQKTLALESEMLDELHRSITAARLRLNRRKAEANEEFKPAKVLQFPAFK